MNNKKNLKVRISMMEHGLKGYEVAEMLGIREEVFSRKMRNELPSEEQDKIMQMIEERRKTNA